MNTRAINLTVGHQGKNDSWEEEWLGYYPEMSNEQAILEVWYVMDNFNNTLRPEEKPREVISFVLGPIVDSKGDEI